MESKHLKAANWDFSPVKHHRIELTGMGNSPKKECSNQSIGIFLGLNVGIKLINIGSSCG